MKKYFSILLLPFVLACTDVENEYFDQITKGQWPENDLQAAQLPIPVYEPLGEMLDWGGWWFCQEISSDEMTAPTRHTDWDDGGKWRVLHTHEWFNTTEAITGMWPRMYRGIARANQLLEQLAPSAGTPTADRVIAELKVMRAFYYYWLIDNHGDVPYVTTFATADPKPAKTPRKEVFDAIVLEIESALADLPSAGPKPVAGKAMAFTLLAKLYLNAQVYGGTAMWDKAEAPATA